MAPSRRRASQKSGASYRTSASIMKSSRAGGHHPQTGREKLREVLMSGGDPMVLSNVNLGSWLSALAEAGIEQVRIGTKELAFFPQRFDATFFDMLDRFHETFPGVALRMMVHFNHPTNCW